MNLQNKDKPMSKGVARPMELKIEPSNKERDLNEIINEIEGLQSEMDASVEEKSPPPADLEGQDDLDVNLLEERHEAASGISLEDEEKVVKMPLDHDWEVEELPSEAGLLSMTMQGKMSLKLCFDASQFVLIGIKGGVLQIRLPQGGELRIPIHSSNSKKAVA